MTMFKRGIEETLKKLAGDYPIVTVTGPRQSGKTTLCRMVFPEKDYINLEQPDLRDFAKNDPKGLLGMYPDGSVIDEIQYAPHLLSYIQVIVDSSEKKGLFILTGSQQFELSQSISQSLAGRTALIKLLPLSINELIYAGLSLSIEKLIYTGFYPRIYRDNLEPYQALGFYTETYLQRDIRQLINVKDFTLFEKFLFLLAGRVGQILNINSLANDVGVSHTTVRHWLSILEASYVIFFLHPWSVNVSKRLIKSPKVYFFDVGLVSYLIGIKNDNQVLRDPLYGNLFENMIVSDILKEFYNRGIKPRVYFFRDSAGNEVDLFIESHRKIIPIEIKAAKTFSDTFLKNFYYIRKFINNLSEQNYIIYAGDLKQTRDNTHILTIRDIHSLIANIS